MGHESYTKQALISLGQEINKIFIWKSNNTWEGWNGKLNENQ